MSRSKKKITTKEMCSIGIMTAVTCILAQIAIPLPGGVPLTMQTFAVTLAGVVLGSRAGGLSILVYVILGAVGVPVLANFTGGFQCLAGPTGGFLISFPIMAYISGRGAEQNKKWKFVLMLIAGCVVNYIVGILFFMVVMKADFLTGMAACVIPFIPTAIIKLVLAGVCGLIIRRRLGEPVKWS